MGKSKKVVKKKKNKLPVIVLSVFAVVSGLVIAKKAMESRTKKEMYRAIKGAVKLLETDPVLSASFFTGKAAYAYQLAKEIPEVIDKQFCYCYCRKNHGHKTLLTCFISDHGEKCDTCINEVLMANDLLKKGYKIEEITEKIDKHFGRMSRRRF